MYFFIYRKQGQTISLSDELTCDTCTIRLLRQALEWGSSYRFVSCGDIRIVPGALSFINYLNWLCTMKTMGYVLHIMMGNVEACIKAVLCTTLPTILLKDGIAGFN